MNYQSSLVGRQFRHKTRGSQYQVIMELPASLEDFEDCQFVYLWGLSDGENYFVIAGDQPELDHMTHVFMRLPMRIQVNAEPTGFFNEVVIYQCLTDNRIWCRYKSEFTDGRFEEIE